MALLRQRGAPLLRLVLLILILVPITASSQVLPDHGLAGNDALLPPGSVAGDASLLALYRNPAGLAFRPGEFGLFYFQGFRASSRETESTEEFQSGFTGNWSLAGGGPLAFGVDHVSLPAGFDYGPGEEDRQARLRRSNRYNLGLSHRFDLHAWRSQLALGAAYRFTRSEAYALDGLSTMDLGAVLRWRRWISLGLVAHNVNRPELRGLEPGDRREIAPSYTLGIALRPQRHWATFSIDVTQLEIENGWDYLSSVGLDLNLGGRARIRLDWRDDSRFSLALSISEAGIRSGLGLSNQHRGDRGTRNGGLSLEWRNRRFGGPLLGGRHFLDLELRGDIPDSPSVAGGALNGRLLLELVEKARFNKDVAGILLRIAAPRMALSLREELRRALLEYRRVTGRPVVVHASSYRLEDYYLATAGSSILINPAGSLRCAEFGKNRLRFMTSIRELGLQESALHHGRYQPQPGTYGSGRGGIRAAEADSSFAAARESFLLRGIAEGRKILLLELPDLIGRGQILPLVARQLSLIDAIVEAGDLSDWLESELGQGRLLRPEQLRSRLLTRERWGVDPALGLIHLDGVLVAGGNGQGLLGHEAGADAFIEILRAARRDRRLDGLLLRVNSGGGGLLACERVRQEIARTRNVKPVVVSFGEAGTGGAYLLGMEADHLIANRSSRVGGIGVWAGEFGLGNLLDRLGLGGAGGFGRLVPPAPPHDPEARRRLQDDLDREYQKFVAAVAGRRLISEPEVELIARGRAWSGGGAIQNGLIDELGGLLDGFAALRRLSDIALGEEITIVEYPERDALAGLLAPWRAWRSSEPPPAAPTLLPAPGETLPAWLARLEPFPEESLLALDAGALPLPTSAVSP
jgi:protease IV